MIPHHRIDGDGEPVVVLSGSLGTTLEMWDELAGELARDHRVVRYDHRGHGRSEVPPAPYTMADVAGDVVDLLDAVGAPTAGFCGLSLGGCVGQWLGVNAPERVERLVLACTSPDFGPPGPWRERARAVRAGGTAAVADVVVGRWFTHTFAADRPEVVARFRQMLVDSPDEGYAGCCDALAEWSFAAELPRLRAPTLVIAAAEDPAAPPAAAAGMAAALPDARLTVLEQASHLACIEQPGAFGRAVRAHLDGEETG